MIDDIHEALVDVGYEALDKNSLREVVSEGSKSVEFTKFIEWITKELQVLYSLDEHVNAIASVEDWSSFLMELNSFLKEIGCSYTMLIEGHINERFLSKDNKILLLDYLLTELKSARMTHIAKPEDSMQVTINETSTATHLKNMLMVMNFPKPPVNIPPKVLFTKVEQKLKEILSGVPESFYGEPLFTGKLSEKQWHDLDNFYKDLFTEYRMRREMLLKRLDVTIQSFEWSERLKQKSDEIKSSFLSVRKSLHSEPNVKLGDILAARKDLAILEKTSSASVRRKTQSQINKVIIGNVPDRGGRPYEQEPPPPEMPAWQQRNNQPGQFRGGGRGGGGGGGGGRPNPVYHGTDNAKNTFNDSTRGGRVQAGWNAPPQNNYNNRGSYHHNRGNRDGNYSRQNSGAGYDDRYGGNSRDRYNSGRGRNMNQDRRNYDDYSSRR